MRKIIWLVGVVLAAAIFVPIATADDSQPAPVVTLTLEAAAPSFPGKFRPAAAEGGSCWGAITTQTSTFSQFAGSWGHRMHTTWCGNGYAITYRSSFATLWSTGICGYGGWQSQYRISGGAGYPDVDVFQQTGFFCAFAGVGWNGAPWFVTHYTGAGGRWVAAEGGF